MDKEKEEKDRKPVDSHVGQDKENIKANEENAPEAGTPEQESPDTEDTEILEEMGTVVPEGPDDVTGPEVMEGKKGSGVIDIKSILGAKKKVLEENKKLQDTTKKLGNEVDTLRDRLQRQTAEYENFRKRSQKEKDAIYGDSISEVVKSILPVLDSLERAVEFEQENTADMNKGVALTLNLLKGALEKLGVTEVDTASGFDPNRHEAVMHVQDEAYGKNEIVEVFMKGYQRDEKIIRHSIVKVAN
jgi:molecular chaperone GrpE